MGSEDLSEADIRKAVRDGVAAGGLRVVATIVWTVVAITTFLIGLQALQFGYLGTSRTGAYLLYTAGFALLGASVYMLYYLYARVRRVTAVPERR